MRTDLKPNRTVTVALALLVSIAVAAISAPTHAQPKVVPVEGVAYKVDSSLVDNLKALQGKKVYLTLSSGGNLAGTVKEVGDGLLHLEKLQGKDYFDALIRIDRIDAIDTRFREIQR